MMKKKLEKHYPLGYDFRPEIILTALMCIFISAWVFLMFRAGLNLGLEPVTQEYADGVRIIEETAVNKVPTFVSLLCAFEMFALVFVFAALTAIYRYFYHYQHSKSIYLMKRLPRRSELYKRCLSGSALISLICLAVMTGLMAVCFIEYVSIVPEEFVRIF